MALLVLLSIFARTEKRPPDEGWKGIFYSNPEDPALLVPKRFGIGWTLNFGNPWSWVVLALMRFARGAAIYLVCFNFASAAIAWQEISSI